MLHLGGIPHVLRAKQFSTNDVASVFSITNALRSAPEKYRGVLQDHLVGVWTSEPSSRTITSMEVAAKNLGATVIVRENMKKFSSVAKGESISRTVKLALQMRMDYLALRWDEEGIADLAAEIAGNRCVVINMGDGAGEHPTQMLLDLYTIYKEFGALDRPFKIVFAGDLKNSRTAHSDVYMLAKYPNVSFDFLSPRGSRMKPGILEYLHEHNCRFEEYVDRPLIELVGDADVAYLIRAQTEREKTAEDVSTLVGSYSYINMTPEVADAMPDHGIFMHPLPSGEELPESMDDHPKARHIQMMGFGLDVRSALFVMMEDVRLNLAATHNRG